MEAVLPANVEESEFDHGAEERASEPGAEVKGLAHAIVGDLAKTGERRFGGDRTEARLDGKTLQKFGGAHGFAESEDGVWVNLRSKRVEPLVNVVAFENAVGGEWASTCAVGARVGKKDGEPVSKQELCISGHAEAIVGLTMEEDHGVAVATMGMDGPGAERDAIWRDDGDILEIRIHLASDLAHGGLGLRRQWAASGMQGSVGYEDASDDGECQVEDQEQKKAAGSWG